MMGGYIIDLIFSAVIGLIAGLGIGYTVGERGGRDTQREAAVQAGVARWTIDAKTGESAFVYGRAEKP